MGVFSDNFYRNQPLIIGSGPAGIAAAIKLISLGMSPVMIDAGLNEEDDHFMSSHHATNAVKTKFGSDLAYRHFKFGPRILNFDSDLAYSFSLGGLSEVWGATFLPFAHNDIVDWPINLRTLEDSYEFIASKVPISTPYPNQLRNYRDFKKPCLLKLDSVFSKVKDIRLNSNKVELGGARLAVRAPQSKQSPCKLCGECLRGCKYGSIWSAKDEIPNLVKKGLILLTGKRVIKLRDNSGKVVVETINKQGKRESCGTFDYVFLAAGTVETFRILATSKFVDSSAFLDHSTTFYFPSIAFGATKSTSNEFGLSQLFLRLQDARGESLAHFQLYASTEGLVDSVIERVKLMKILPDSWKKKFFSRVVFTIGYTNGVQDSDLEFTLNHNEDVVIKGRRRRAKVHQKLKISVTLLKSGSAFFKLGLVPIIGLLNVGQPGNGVHAGSWLFKSGQCNEIGKVNKHRSIYVIDSSSLPTIPNGPITMTVMANAVRIVTEIFN